MKHLQNSLIGGNIVISAFLVIYKVFLDKSTCEACSYVSVSQVQLSFMALAGSIVIATLCWLSQKYKRCWYAYVMAVSMCALISSGLMILQLKKANSICVPCFTSEVLFYLIFIFLALQHLMPWMHEKWFRL